jgi:predicted transcriptional regulator
MAAPKRKKTQREFDLTRVAEMYLTGKRQVDIAVELGVTQQQVSYDLQELHTRWRESSLIDIGEAKNRELERIDILEQEYWAAWVRSCGERTKTKHETLADEESVRSSVEVEQMLVNPAYLAGVQSCIESRCKIIGLYAPAKQEHTGKDGGPIMVKGYANFSPDDWDNDATG